MPARTYAPPRFRFEPGSGFLLLLALVWFFDDGGLLPPLAAAAGAHELGHVAALLAFGAYPTRLRASLSGFALDYAGTLTDAQLALTALAGPAAGAGFAALCAALGARTGNAFWLSCAGIGAVLTVFNLLPAAPLDGGVCAEYALVRLFGADFATSALHGLGIAVTGLLAGGGVYALFSGDGPALLLAGVWLFALRQGGACNRA